MDELGVRFNGTGDASMNSELIRWVCLVGVVVWLWFAIVGWRE